MSWPLGIYSQIISLNRWFYSDEQIFCQTIQFNGKIYLLMWTLIQQQNA